MVDIEAFEKEFRKKYYIKKMSNAILNLMISLFGFSTLINSFLIKHYSIASRYRYMTFNGTTYTSVICFIFFIICLLEATKNIEISRDWIYYLRLSSAVTEFIILCVVLAGLTSLVPDYPDVHSYNGVVMHLIVPVLSLFSFVFNDSPLGKIRLVELWWGTLFLTIYTVVTGILFGFGIVPSELAPYSFLNFETSSWLYQAFTLIFIYSIAYLISFVLYRLNRKMSWIWFNRSTKNAIQ